MARHSRSLPRGLSIDPGSAPRHTEDATSPLGSEAAVMRRRSVSMGLTPRSRVGLLRLMSRGQDVSKETKYAVLPHCAEHAVQTHAMIYCAVLFHTMAFEAVLVHATLSICHAVACMLCHVSHAMFIMLCCHMLCCLMSCQLCCAVLLC